MKENLLVSFTRDPPMKYWETILEIPFPQLFMCFRLVTPAPLCSKIVLLFLFHLFPFSPFPST